MNSNNPKNIINPDGHLNRADIDRYRVSNDEREKNSIEKKSISDSFNSAAFDGWEKSAFDTSLMKKLDRRFGNRKFNFWLVSVVSAVIIGTLVIWILIPNSANERRKTEISDNNTSTIYFKQGQEITIEKSDFALPEPIEKMNKAPKKDQINPKNMVGEFVEMNLEKEKIELNPLPLKKVKEDKEIILVENHRNAKEIYLHQLKLVDYRQIRKNSDIKTTQMVMSGTPANKEDEKITELDPVWKEVYVPYIDYLDKTMLAFSNEQYKKTLARFNIVLSTYPNDVNANFYTGICLYNLGEYNKAILAFNKCLSGPYSNFDEESKWMMAMSYEKTGAYALANKIYAEIISDKGFYANQAMAKLKQ